MQHSDTLKLLFPAELVGVFNDDIALSGKQLDAAQTSADGLLLEMYPDRASDRIADWERVCGLTPATGATLQTRQNTVLRKLRERGGMSRTYFIALAAVLGHTITIDELLPFMAGWSRADDHIYVEGVRWIWQVNVASTATELEALFEELKPAHTAVIFNYE